MPAPAYTIKCHIKHSYNLQDITIEGRQEVISFLSQTIYILFEKIHKSTQNDNPSDGSQLFAASEMLQEKKCYSTHKLWRWGTWGEVPAGGVNFTCETERVQRKTLERLRFASHPQSASLSCPDQKVRSLLPRKKGLASCSRKRAVGGYHSKGSFLVLFLYPLKNVPQL